jgi:RNA polymerase sigma factor (TIGR02999 family)
MAGERPGHTLQVTALVNEAYLRLIDASQMRWQNRAHFFGVAAQMMRQILVDFARSRQSQKRGGEVIQVPLDEALVVSKEKEADLVALDDALKALGAIDPRRSQMVELRFFGGLSVEETAEVLKTSPRTVLREWSLAQAWLYRELRKGTNKRVTSDE